MTDRGFEPAADLGPGLVEAVWKYRRLVVLATLVAAVSAFGLSFLQETMYRGEARLILADPRNQGVFDVTRVVIDPSRYVRNQAERITSSVVLSRAVELEGGRLSLEEAADRVEVEPALNLDLITIRALDPTPEGAASLADSVAEAYQQIVGEEVQRNAEAAIAELEQTRAELEARVDELTARLRADPNDPVTLAERDAAVSQIAELKTRAEQIAVDAALFGSGVELFEPAEVPESPARPQPVRNAALGGLLGLMASAAWAWWQADRTQSADRRHDPAPVLGAPLLAEVPEFTEVGAVGPLPAANAPKSAAGEAYQFLVSSLEYVLEGHGSQVVLVTSPLQGDGKTVTAANLAVAAVRDGRRTLLVDADERMRELSRLFGVDGPGLVDLATPSEAEATRAVVKVGLPQGGELLFTPAGSNHADPAGFFRSAGFRRALARLRSRADLVILDSPPLLAVSDTSALAGQVDGIVLVVRRGTPFSVLSETKERLSFVGAPLLGYVFNRSAPAGGGYYSYGYGYGYGYSGDGSGRTGLRRRSRHSTSR